MTLAESITAIRNLLEAKKVPCANCGGTGILCDACKGTKYVVDPAYAPLLALLGWRVVDKASGQSQSAAVYWASAPDGTLDGALCWALAENEELWAAYLSRKADRHAKQRGVAYLGKPLSNQEAAEALLEALNE